MGEKKDQRYLDLVISRKNDFLYPLIFQEYIYTLAHDHNLFPTIVLENLGYDKRFRFLIVKRLITRMYEQNHLSLSAANLKENLYFLYNNLLYSQKISEGLSIIVEIPFSLQLGTFLKNLELIKVQNLQSIHSIFPFLEDKFPYLNLVSDGLFPYPIHLEKLVQILRYWLKDPSSLHFLRFFFHENWNHPFFQKKSNSFSFLKKRNIRLFVFLYNSYVYEYESILFFIRRQFFHLPSKPFRFYFERLYFYGKAENFTEVFSKGFPSTLELFKDPNMHYIRYQGKFFFAYRGMPLLMNKWKYYFGILFQNHFDVWLKPDNIHINPLYKHSFHCVGYLLSFKWNPSLIRSQMLLNTFSIENTMKKMDIVVPIILMIDSLSKMKFCNKIGHPVSKSTWTDSLDSDIIDRFVRLCNKISYFYSGSSKKKDLYQIHYILRFACLKTLARKHKTSVRSFFKKLGSSFLEELFLEQQISSLILIRSSSRSSDRSHQSKVRVWYLDIISMNDLINHE
uniref:Maturase K n=1 Tax=Ledermanniella linearifolia TaxID=348070 RepID=I7HGS6_9ROSI|nr:maturase K [Ledermanniella linearifolia]BAM33840.1 maturase K [Ledermanniella linearifolia]BAM33842.1 maturase K [Ledermanniella linearifolia]BAM33843.1 maturase K [Ledermanniella linearifolia]BAM33844.1 maturase K [Ledermanniella linearifolia]